MIKSRGGGRERERERERESAWEKKEKKIQGID